MKSPTAPILLLTLASLAVASAQNQPPRVRRVPTPPGVAQPTPPVANQLEENITISLEGSLSDGSPIDIALTGCGRLFQTEMVMGKVEIADNSIPVIGTVSITVTENDGAYFLEYRLGVRSPIETTNPRVPPVPGRASVSFEDILITGTVKCSPGKAVQIFKSGDDALKLSVKKAEGG